MDIEPAEWPAWAGGDVLARQAPDVAVAFTRLRTQVWEGSASDRLALVDLRVADLLGHEVEPGARPLATPAVAPAQRRRLSGWPTDPHFTDEERACLAFAEQFVIDVAGVDDRLRSEVGSALGSSVLDFVVAVFVLDYTRRVDMVLHQLFPDQSPPGTGDGGAGDGSEEAAASGGPALLGSFDELSRRIALLDGLDPVTTELVRLRGARQHNCRLCQSTRSARALEAGADEALFDATERYEASELAPHQKAALCLTDAMITGPGSVDPAVVAQVHQAFTPAQVVELVMDVMRNSGQKIAVALAADQPHVTSGIERFEITASGDVAYLA